MGMKALKFGYRKLLKPIDMNLKYTLGIMEVK
jgi:hypothetical protein